MIDFKIADWVRSNSNVPSLLANKPGEWNWRDVAAVTHRGIQALDEGEIHETQYDVDAAGRDELRKRIDGNK